MLFGSLTIFAFSIQRCLPRCSNYLKNSGASTTGFVKNQLLAKIVKEPAFFSSEKFSKAAPSTAK